MMTFSCAIMKTTYSYLIVILVYCILQQGTICTVTSNDDKRSLMCKVVLYMYFFTHTLAAHFERTAVTQSELNYVR